MRNDGVMAVVIRKRVANKLLVAGARALERERSELMAMPCRTLPEAMAVSRKMRAMLARYGQEACTGLFEPGRDGDGP